MPGVYCQHCFALISEEAERCNVCKRRNSHRRMNPAIGAFLFVFFFGAICTAVYARVMYIGWPTWQKIFEPKDFKSDNYANEAANS